VTYSVSGPADTVYATSLSNAAFQRFAVVQKDSGVGEADIAVALRGWLRMESQQAGFAVIREWTQRNLSADVVNRAGLERSAQGWRAKPWTPDWLDDVPAGGVDDAWLPTRRRVEETVPGDPPLRLLDLTSFTSSAQRDAVRAVCCGRPGQTIAVCLPTGAGKSLCAFLPALLPQNSETGLLGVSLIVVPTVALALDLEARLVARVGHAIAYRPDEKVEADGIRQRCEAGVQGPIIVSPEALAGRLLTVLRDAAKRGHLRHFVVDEAHIVLSWGDEFRPAFLRLAAIRRDLTERSAGAVGFVTVLLSATFTDYHLRWLRTLLSDGAGFSVVHAARLRPEPSYWLARAASPAQRDGWIDEAVFRLPRPCIIYTTQRDECRRWHERLRAQGFTRVAMMTSKSTDAQRRALLRDWTGDRIDIVVATSAFGLGIDKSGVRAIIHAELPESVDRFYQDVGRAGRDGHSAISLLISCADDRSAALSMSRPKFITGQLGLARWRRLHGTREAVRADSDVFLVNLGIGRGMDMRGDYNRNWNLRTLQLLARAGAIEFVGDDRESFNRVAIRMLPVQSLSTAYWSGRVEEIRTELISDYVRSGRLLRRLDSKQKTCLSDIFVECYSSPTFDLPVVVACGGCPVCRASRERPRCGRLLARRNPDGPAVGAPVGVDLMRWLGGQSAGLILLPSVVTAKPEAVAILSWCAAQGVRTFVLPPEMDDLLDQAAQFQPGSLMFRLDRIPRTRDVVANQSLLVWLSETPPVGWRECYTRLGSAGIPTVIVAPAGLRAPGERNRLLRDIFPGPVMALQAWSNQFVA
jgi:ATP-dependent DNA helicase RecQ